MIFLDLLHGKTTQIAPENGFAIQVTRAPQYNDQKMTSFVSHGAPTCPLPPNAARVRLWWSVKLRWPVLNFFYLFFSLLLPGNTRRSLMFAKCLFGPWSLDFAFITVFSIQFLIFCNYAFQLKLIIYVGFQFSHYSFDFRFAFSYFNYFGMQVLIASDLVLQLKFVIYFIFHFGPYSFNFVKTL